MNRIGTAELARRLGITTAAVSNWRRRYPDFPTGADVDGQPLFAVEELTTWLDGRRIAKDDRKPDEAPGTTYGTRFRKATGIVTDEVTPADVWRELDRLRGTADIALLTDLVLGLLYLAGTNEPRWAEISRAPADQLPDVIGRAAPSGSLLLGHLNRAITADSHRLQVIVGWIDRARRSNRTTETFEYLVERFMTSEGRRSAAVHTPPDVVRLVVELTDPAPGDSVLDPCCETGRFLIAATDHLGDRAGESRFTGHSLSDRGHALTAMNLALRDVRFGVDTYSEAFLAHESPLLPASSRHDVIVSNPPFGMRAPGQGPRGSNFVWLERVAASLADGGRAAVVMPGGTLFRGGRDQRARTELVDSGLVEGVVGLPARLFPATGIPVTLWLLHRGARERTGEILLVDAGAAGEMVSRTRRSLSDDDRRRIVNTVGDWRTGEYANVPDFAMSVPVELIRANDYVLTPARYFRPSRESGTSSVADLRGELDELHRHADDVDRAAALALDRISAWLS